MNLIWITDARYVSDYIIELTFNNGIQKEVDLAKIINSRKKLFSPLLDLDVFKSFVLGEWTLSWLDGKIDIAPERLYEVAMASDSNETAA